MAELPVKALAANFVSAMAKLPARAAKMTFFDDGDAIRVYVPRPIKVRMVADHSRIAQGAAKLDAD
jgi:hypothetical protein